MVEIGVEFEDVVFGGIVVIVGVGLVVRGVGSVVVFCMFCFGYCGRVCFGVKDRKKLL